VQFIHKTFKDFIRSPNNIPNTGDKPATNIRDIGCTSLLKASGYILKYLNADERFGHENIYRNAFHYAAQLENNSRASKWVDECATGSISISKAKSLRQATLRGLEYDLATLAANHGGLYYVKRKVNNGLLTEYPKQCALLWSVVSGFVLSRSSFAFSTPRWGIDDYIRLLAYLVDRGAHVGSTWSSMDELQLLLNSFKQISSPTDILDTLKMVEWLLQNGANPNQQFKTNYTKGYGESPALWFLLDREIWLYQLWKLLLQYGADPIVRGYHSHHLLYFAIRKGESKIAKLLCRAGADPTKLGQGINSLRLDQCTQAQFPYQENIDLFSKTATQMQHMLRKFSNHEETVRIGAEAMESDSTEESCEESDNAESWEEPSDSSRQSNSESPRGGPHKGTSEDASSESEEEPDEND
jgi:hypothetical protein